MERPTILDRLEPDIMQGCSETAPLKSAAISLKRIADIMTLKQSLDLKADIEWAERHGFGDLFKPSEHQRVPATTLVSAMGYAPDGDRADLLTGLVENLSAKGFMVVRAPHKGKS